MSTPALAQTGRASYLAAPKNIDPDEPLVLFIVLHEKDASAEKLAQSLQPFADEFNCVFACPSLPESVTPDEIGKMSGDIATSVAKALKAGNVPFRNDAVFIAGMGTSAAAAVKFSASKPGALRGVVLLSPTGTLPEEDLSTAGMTKTAFFILSQKGGDEATAGFKKRLDALNYKNTLLVESTGDDWKQAWEWVKGFTIPKPCFTAVPAKYDASVKWPVMIAMHGFGSNSEAHAQKLQAVADAEGCIIVCPTLPNIMNPGDVAKQAGRLLKAAEKEMKSYNVDETRVYISSVSFSAMAAFRMAATDPRKFKALIICAPSKSPDIEDMARQGMEKLQVYVWQGAQDKLVEAGRNMSKSLKELKYEKAIYNEVPGFGHQTPPVEQWAEIFKWVNGK